MTLFLNAHADRIAPGSFQQPVPIPPHQPGEAEFVQVCFNKDWLPYVLGCLFQLTLSTTWSANTDSELKNALQMANDLILIFQLARPGCDVKAPGNEGTQGDDMCCCLRMQDGMLQVFSCGEWKTVEGWDPSAIAPRQPGTGSPQPASGTCQQFSGVIEPTVSWLLPVPVNSGDTITVSNLQGAWSPSQFTDIWLCPDGNLFFAGFCADHTQAYDAGAPMPSAPLNGTILYDGTNYYDVSLAANAGTPVTVTIAPGVVNAQLLVRCNFHGGIEPAGNVTFDIQVCNNAIAPWSHVITFTTGPSGWVADNSVYTTTVSPTAWVPSTGWEAGHYQGAGQDAQVISIKWDFGSTVHISALQLNFDRTVGSNPQGDSLDYVIGYRDSGGTGHNLATGTAQGTNLSISFPASQDCNGIFFYDQQDAGNSPYTPNGSGRAFSMTVSGTGLDPFAGL